MRLYRGIILSAVALFALSAMAARMSADDAADVARAFSRFGGRLGSRFAGDVAQTRRHLVRDGVPFYSVRMRDRGTVFVSEEGGLVVAFTSSTVDFDMLEKDSPLRVLLERDAKVRGNLAALGINDSSPYYSDHTNRLSAVDDIRVAPLVKSKWNQGSAGGHYCFNYYTPNHSVCGCTATAMAQLMRFYEYPVDPIPSVAKQCSVDGSDEVLRTQGGVYEWAKMTLVPKSSNYSDESWAAIGKLTSDIGIALQSDYSRGSTGANPDFVTSVLVSDFGYSNAVMYSCDDVYYEAFGYKNDGDGLVRSDLGLHNRANRQNMICANLDAGRPVMLGIYGYTTGHVGDVGCFSGHAIVGDGYGYCDIGGEKVPYLHLNLGWGGSDDAWYNVPEICTAETGAVAGDSGFDFTVFYACIGNIFTDRSGGEIVSGRVLDAAGDAIAAAEVSIDGVGTVTTDENGIYAFVVPESARYDVQAVSGGVTGIVDVVVGRTTSDAIGNRWGVDVILGADIRERLTPTNFYVSAATGLDAPDRGTFAAPYATIQYAITNGQPLVAGDVINVLPGVYHGCVETPGTPVSIVSTEGPEATVIDGDGWDCCYFGGANLQNMISGFTITNGAYYGGVYGGIASNCVIVGCENSADGAGFGGGAYKATLYDCVLHNNDAYYGGGAANCVLVNCTVYDNWASSAGGGIDCDCIVTNSIVWRNRITDDDLIENWERYESGWGSRAQVYVPAFAFSCTFPEGFDDLGGNITNDPMCVSFDIDDWRLRAGSPCAGADSRGMNMGAWQGDPLVGYVISTEVDGRGSVSPWSRFVLAGEDATFTAVGDHPFLGFETNGVMASSDRGFVWRDVRADGVLTACFGVTNYCLDAAIGDDENDGLSWETPLRSVYAMTRKAGRGDRVKVGPGVYEGCDWCVYGVEVESTDGASATIIDGGGTNRCIYADEMTYRGFTFVNGNAPRGYGGGVYCGTYVDCVVSNCVSAAGGGAAYAVMTNCLVVGCEAVSYRSGSRWYGGYGAGAYLSELYNCTLFGNGVDSCGVTNVVITDDPSHFRDVAKGDYRLRPSSSFVDAGDPTYVSVDHDLDGADRVWGDGVDCGCYEYRLPSGVTDPSGIGVAEALAREGYRGEYAAAVAATKDYAYLVEWTRGHGLSATDLNLSPTGFLSPALDADGLIDLDPTNIVLRSFAPSKDGSWKLSLTLPGYDDARINAPLLGAAVGVVGSDRLDGAYSADGLDYVVTPASAEVEVTVSPRAGGTRGFLKITVR